MHKKLWRGLCGTMLIMAVPMVAGAKETKIDVKRLQAENQRLAEELEKTQKELQRLKANPPEISEVGSPRRGPREMNAPLPLTPAEQEGAPGGGAATSSVPAKDENKDFTVAIGTKLWMNNWTTWRTPRLNNNPDFSQGTNISTLTSTSTEVSPIPTFTARYKDFFLSGSYLSETDYAFPSQSDIINFNDPLQGPTQVPLNYNLSGSRQEWDVTLGYQILPYLAVTAGYKEINQKFRQQGCSFTVVGISYPCIENYFNADITYAGPTLGISGAAPFGHGFGMYGNFTYGWLGANYRDSAPENAVDDIDYYVGELGFTYTHLMKEMPVYMPLSSATAYAGYRYQTYSGFNM